jgi:hypothetical protein
MSYIFFFVQVFFLIRRRWPTSHDSTKHTTHTHITHTHFYKSFFFKACTHHSLEKKSRFEIEVIIK